jgi:hypothetical protein
VAKRALEILNSERFFQVLIWVWLLLVLLFWVAIGWVVMATIVHFVERMR